MESQKISELDVVTSVSGAEIINITAAAIGAATTSHTHSNYALATALTALTERVAALEADVAALKNPEQTE